MKTRLPVLDISIDLSAAAHNGENGRKPDVPALLAFWKNNKYPLLALNHGSAPPELFGAPEFQAAFNAENATYDSLKAEYHLVRERWAKAGIRSLLIKSGGVFPSFPYTSDNLDVLIEAENEERAKAILREAGYVELKNIEEPKKFLFRKFSEGASISAIHLHTQVGWLVGFMEEKDLWERAKAAPDDASITVPSPEDVILIILAHSFYENKKFRLADIEKMRQWWGRDNTDWVYIKWAAWQRGWLDGLQFCLLVCARIEEAVWGETIIPEAVRKDSEQSLKRMPLVYRYCRKMLRRAPVTLPFEFSFLFSKYLYYKKIMNDKDISFPWRLRDAFHTLAIGVKVRLRVRPQPAFLVSFSGPDGCGKTVHAENLVKILDISEVNAKYYWNRTATSPLIRFFSGATKKFTGQSLKSGEAKTGAVGREKRLRNPFLRFSWSYLAAADMVWSYFLNVRLPMLFGRVVVCDRYVYDAAAEMECSLMPKDRVNRLAIKMMLALSPKPDIAYFLEVPDEVCARRKSDNTDPDYLLRQTKAYLALALKYNLKIIKSDKDFRQIADEITREVLPAYYRDYGTFLRGLFLSNPGQLNKHRKGKQI